MPAGASLASAAFTGFGAGMSGMAGQESGAYNAQVATNNQTVANENATLALAKGNFDAAQMQQKTVQTVSADRAGSGASGVDVNSGSALRTQEDTARIGANDVQTIQQNAERSAWGFRAQASQFGAQAELAKSQGRSALIGSILGGGGNFANKWNSFQTAGIGSTNGNDGLTNFLAQTNSYGTAPA